MHDYSEDDEPVGEEITAYEQGSLGSAGRVERMEVGGVPVDQLPQTLGNPVRIDVTMHRSN